MRSDLPSLAISLEDLVYAWPGQPPLLEIESLQVQIGERIFLQGDSGSGKSTFLGLISGVLTPDQGKLSVLGQEIGTVSARKRDRLRAEEMGVIFQMFNLLPFLNVLQNVTLACQFSKERRARVEGDLEAGARAFLARLGLEGDRLLKRHVSALSVGQQQRVAVARALLGRPKLVLADEPTSALDERARDRFMDLLFAEVERSGATLIMVSHDKALANRFDRALDLSVLNRASQREGTE